MGSLNDLRFVLSGFGFVTGAVFGSFVKVLADRSIGNKSFLGRSYCAICKHKLAWYDLFPVISYLILSGKCRYCKKKISIEYLLVEVVMGLVIAFLFLQGYTNFSGFQFPARIATQSIAGGSIIILDLLFKAFFITVLAVLFITDLKKMFIPDRITYPAIAISFTYIVAITAYKIWYLYFYLSQSKLGRLLLPPNTDYFQRHALITAYPLFGSIGMAVLIGGFFTLLILITRGKGMGGGDVKLGALMGLALGFPNALVALMISFISGAIVSIGLIIFKRKHFGQSIPFGPFLVLGSLIALFWGNIIVEWYLHISI